MKLKLHLSIGYPTADQKETIDLERAWGITDEEWNDMSEDEQEDTAMQWAWDHIDFYYEELP